jgi:hypothetical protein
VRFGTQAWLSAKAGNKHFRLLRFEEDFDIILESEGLARVSAYKIQRRERPEGAWQEVGTAIETESTLVDQPKGKELEYRVIAINKSGEGSPSNTVMVVL